MQEHCLCTSVPEGQGECPVLIGVARSELRLVLLMASVGYVAGSGCVEVGHVGVRPLA